MSEKPTQDQVAAELWAAMSRLEFLTMQEIMAKSGRKSAGGGIYNSIMSSLIFSGQVERDYQLSETGRGRYRKLYRAVNMDYYNKIKDPRFIYEEWDNLAEVVREQARERYEGKYEWLDFEDWSYPVTRKEVTRLGRGDRVLNISVEDAERKRVKWRENFAAGFLRWE